MKLRVTLIALLMASFVQAQGVWTMAEVANLGSTVYRLRVADARGDGTERVYCGTRSGGVHELSYEKGLWTSRQIGDVPGIAFDLLVAAGRGDEKLRVYVPCQNGHTYEFSYNQGDWERLDMGGVNDGADMDQVAFGYGRNDRVMRGYVTLDNGHLWEYTWTDGRWTGIDLGRFAEQLLDVTVGKSSHGRIVRLYSSSQDGGLYELTWNGAEWCCTKVDQFTSPRAAWGIELGLVSPLDREGTPDEATTAEDAGLDLFVTAECERRVFRYRWQNGGWRRISVGTAGYSGGDVCLGPGRGRAVRLYQSSKDARIYEFTLCDGRWRKAQVGQVPGEGGMGVTVGPGRGDRRQHVYACSPDGAVVEFTYQGRDDGPGEGLPVAETEELSASPNPFRENTVLSGAVEATVFQQATIVDASGRVVKTVAGSPLPDGRAAWFWDGTDAAGMRLAPGCYFCVVTTAGGTIRRALQLLQ